MINVVDLFSGPGGLGEGFSSVLDDNRRPAFQIKMSVEIDKDAHQTLTHRAFFRKLPAREKKYFLKYCEDPKGYGSLVLSELKSKHHEKWAEALAETLHEPTALGNSNIWEKLKHGGTITKKDREDTEDQKKISTRIKEIKEDSKTSGQFTVLIGGPPCQAYSGPGRNRSRSIENYNPDEDQRFFLYREYCRALAELSPDIFVMENVPGITSAKLANGKLIFPKILRALEEPAAEVGIRKRRRRSGRGHYKLFSLNDWSFYSEDTHTPDFKLLSSDYGVPQSRSRVIIVGIGSHLQIDVDSIGRLRKKGSPTLSEVVSDLPLVRSGISRRDHTGNRIKDSNENWHNDLCQIRTELVQELMSELKSIPGQVQDLNHVLDSLKSMRNVQFDTRPLRRLVVTSRIQRQRSISNAIDFFEKDYRTEGKHTKETKYAWLRLVASVESEVMKSVRAKEKAGKLLPKAISYLKKLPKGESDLTRGNPHFVKFDDTYSPFDRISFVARKSMTGALNHSTKEHQRFDRKLYLFCSAWANVNDSEKHPSPRSIEFPTSLVPDHQNWNEGHYADRFRCLKASSVAPTITSHLSKDGHAFIHYDSAQNRSLTPREAARIQTFPDDYFFEGEHSSQCHQVGNAVPPLLAREIAQWVYKLLRGTKTK